MTLVFAVVVLYSLQLALAANGSKFAIAAAQSLYSHPRQAKCTHTLCVTMQAGRGAVY